MKGCKTDKVRLNCYYQGYTDDYLYGVGEEYEVCRGGDIMSDTIPSAKLSVFNRWHDRVYRRVKIQI